jgi:hypothetical protein
MDSLHFLIDGERGFVMAGRQHSERPKFKIQIANGFNVELIDSERETTDQLL